jgi:hypothetical protein
MCLFQGVYTEASLSAVLLLLAHAVVRMRVYVWLAIGSSFLTILMAYLTPFTHQDPVVLTALAILLATALIAGYAAHGLEHDALLRLLMSQRPTVLPWSKWLFGMIAAPLAALSLAFVVLQNPGVLQGADGIFDYVLVVMRGLWR